jgi:hypothetical protein
MSKKFRMPESSCPNCGHAFNAATSMDGASPGVDDLTVCIGCGEILKFSQELIPVKLDDGELEQWRQEEPEGYAELMRVATAIQSTKSDRREKQR